MNIDVGCRGNGTAAAAADADSDRRRATRGVACRARVSIIGDAARRSHVPTSRDRESERYLSGRRTPPAASATAATRRIGCNDRRPPHGATDRCGYFIRHFTSSNLHDFLTRLLTNENSASRPQNQTETVAYRGV